MADPQKPWEIDWGALSREASLPPVSAAPESAKKPWEMNWGPPASAFKQDDEPAKPKKKEPVSWGEVPLVAAGNLPKSALGQLEQMWEGAKAVGSDVVSSIGQGQVPATVTNLGRLAVTVPGSLPGMPVPNYRTIAATVGKYLDPGARDTLNKYVDKMYAPQDAIVQDYKEAYGTDEARRRTFSEDPARVLMDLATLAIPPGKIPKAITTAGKAAATASAAGQTATLADKVGQAARATAMLGDPSAQLGVGVQKLPSFIAEMHGLHTGTGGEALREMTRATREGGQKAQDVWAGLKGTAEPEHIVGLAEKAADAIDKRGWDAYVRAKNGDPSLAHTGWANEGNVKFEPVLKAWREWKESKYTPEGYREIGDDAWNKIMKIENEFMALPRDGLVGGELSPRVMDAFKRRVGTLYEPNEAGAVKQAVASMRNIITKQLKDQVPGYAAAMKNASEAQEASGLMRQAFSLNDHAAMETQLRKLQSVMRNDVSTNYGSRVKALKKLEEEGNVSIKPFLAGQMLSSTWPRGLARGAVGAGSLAGLGAGIATGDLGILAASLGLAGMTSPKLSGALYGGFGTLAGFPERTARGARKMLEKATGRPEGSLAIPPGYLSSWYSAPARQGYRIGAEAAPYMPQEEPRYAEGGAVNQPYRFQLAPAPTLSTAEPPPLLPWPKPQPMGEQLGDLLVRSIDRFGKMSREAEAAANAEEIKKAKEAMEAAAERSKTAKLDNAVAAATPPKVLSPMEAPDTGEVSPPVTGGDYYTALGKMESVDNPSAMNPSGAGGLYQFMPDTWKGMVQRYPHLGLTIEGRTPQELMKANPALTQDEAVKIAREQQNKAIPVFTAENAAVLKKNLNKADLEPVELYMAHLMGATGASGFLSKLDVPLSSAVSDAVRNSNPAVFYDKKNKKWFATGRDVLQHLRNSGF